MRVWGLLRGIVFRLLLRKSCARVVIAGKGKQNSLAGSVVGRQPRRVLQFKVRNETHRLNTEGCLIIVDSWRQLKLCWVSCLAMSPSLLGKGETRDPARQLIVARCE